jgi:hypothetical protein
VYGIIRGFAFLTIFSQIGKRCIEEHVSVGGVGGDKGEGYIPRPNNSDRPFDNACPIEMGEVSPFAERRELRKKLIPNAITIDLEINEENERLGGIGVEDAV